MNQSTGLSVKPWLRAIALITCVIFTTTSTAWGGDPGLAPSANAPAPTPSESETYIHDTLKKFFDDLDLPDSIGQVKKSFQGNRDKIVIHIQDAHANEEAQRNIAKILDYFIAKHGMKLINVEGAEGELYPELFNFYPRQEVRREVSDFFLKNGRLSAAEYLVIVNRPDASLFGVEDKKFYDQNRQAYLDALGFKERDEKILSELGKVLTDVSRFVFSDEMRELVRRRSSFQDGGREMIGYVRYLVETAQKHNIAIHDFAGLQSLLKLIAMERDIDMEKAEQEIGQLTGDLKKVLSRERLSRFLTNSVQFRMKKMKRSEYYGYLETEIRQSAADESSRAEQDLQKKYENVLKYLRYIQLYDSLDLEILDEIEALEKTIKNKLLSSAEEVTLDRLMRIYDVEQKLFEFSLTKQDAMFFYAYRDEFKVKAFQQFLDPLFKKHHFSYGLPSQMELLDQDLPRVERFYEAALARDGILIRKAVEKMDSDGVRLAALVTGGFHTPGIEKYLREHDYSYLVIMPRITKLIDRDKATVQYENALSGKPLPLEKVLSESLLAPQSPILNDPRLQLAVEPMVGNRAQGVRTLKKPAAKAFTATCLLRTLAANHGELEAARQEVRTAVLDTPALGTDTAAVEIMVGHFWDADAVSLIQKDPKTGQDVIRFFRRSGEQWLEFTQEKRNAQQREVPTNLSKQLEADDFILTVSTGAVPPHAASAAVQPSEADARALRVAAEESASAASLKNLIADLEILSRDKSLGMAEEIRNRYSRSDAALTGEVNALADLSQLLTVAEALSRTSRAVTEAAMRTLSRSLLDAAIRRAGTIVSDQLKDAEKTRQSLIDRISEQLSGNLTDGEFNGRVETIRSQALESERIMEAKLQPLTSALKGSAASLKERFVEIGQLEQRTDDYLRRYQDPIERIIAAKQAERASALQAAAEAQRPSEAAKPAPKEAPAISTGLQMNFLERVIAFLSIAQAKLAGWFHSNALRKFLIGGPCAAAAHVSRQMYRKLGFQQL